MYKLLLYDASIKSGIIFTSDNPRSEDPKDILDEIEKGVSPENFKKTLTIIDRKQAIKTACKLANQGDIILVAGKGHENYQEIKGERFHFDDLEELNNNFNQLKH